VLELLAIFGVFLLYFFSEYFDKYFKTVINVYAA